MLSKTTSVDDSLPKTVLTSGTKHKPLYANLAEEIVYKAAEQYGSRRCDVKHVIANLETRKITRLSQMKELSASDWQRMGARNAIMKIIMKNVSEMDEVED